MSEFLETLYHDRFSPQEISRNSLIWDVLCRDYFQQYVSLEDRILDVASGHGHFINHIFAKNKVALDLNSEASKYLNSDISFVQANILHFDETNLGLFDVIFVSNFFEHLQNKDELEIVLEKIKNLLKTDGKLIIMGPNIKYLGGLYWDFYDHHLPLTEKSLDEILKIKGFSIQESVARFLPYTTKGRLPTHPFFVKLYLKLKVLWPFFGKQFFIVASK